MNTVHTLREYVDALRDAGILVESTVSDELAAREIHCLTYDTRALSEDALFICKGAHFKEEYLCDALSRGAIAYVAEKKHNVDAPCLLVNDIRYSLVVLGQLFYNHVTDKLTSVGITGTKGKSTTAYYVRYILNDWLRAQSMPECAILSSIDNYDGKSTEESHITTPEVLELYQHFENAYECGISHLVMEASSQALKYGRVRGITYDVAAFLNIGSDHISPIEHPDFEDYFNSKLKIFDSCRFGCVNTDAKYSDRVIEYAKDRCNLITFGSHESDTVSCQHVEKRSDGLYFTVSSLKYNGEFSITMPGLFNISNALAAMAICMVLDVPEEYVRSGLRKARAAGRMQIYESRDKNVTVIVDYAHNRMSFDALYRSTKIEYPGRQMISVFGCPGSHALQRRKDLGELSGQNCDFVFITEEDSGEEPFAQIAADIEKHVACPHLVLEDPRRVHPPRNSGRQGRARHSADRQGRRDNDEARQRLRPLPERRRAHAQIPRRIRQSPSRRAGEQRQKGKKGLFAHHPRQRRKRLRHGASLPGGLSRHTAAAVHAAARAHAQLTPVSLPHHPGF